MRTEINVGTRKSKLALRQTMIVVNALQSRFPEIKFNIKEISTKGDKDAHQNLNKIAGKGIFVKTIEQKLLDKSIDFAVHSLKDVNPALPKGLTIGSVPKRESPFDCLISRHPYETIVDLPTAARIGTNSLRRKGQLLHLRPDLKIIPIRGNINIRIQKIWSQHLEGVILAEAGLNRLKPNLAHLYRKSLASEISPAVGQGALAIECRGNDKETLKIIGAVNDLETYNCVNLEREFLKALGGKCDYPIGGYVHLKNKSFQFQGVICSVDGKSFYSKKRQGEFNDHIGKLVAKEMIKEDLLKLIQKK